MCSLKSHCHSLKLRLPELNPLPLSSSHSLPRSFFCITPLPLIHSLFKSTPPSFYRLNVVVYPAILQV